MTHGFVWKQLQSNPSHSVPAITMGCSKSQNDLLHYLKVEISSGKCFSKSLWVQANKKEVKIHGNWCRANPPCGALTAMAPSLPSAVLHSLVSCCRAEGLVQGRSWWQLSLVPFTAPTAERREESNGKARQAVILQMVFFNVVNGAFSKICIDWIGPQCHFSVSSAKWSLYSSIKWVLT